MKKDKNKRRARNKLDSTTIVGIVTLAIVVCAAVSGIIMWANVYIWDEDDVSSATNVPSKVTASRDPNLDPYYQGNAPVGGGANID